MRLSDCLAELIAYVSYFLESVGRIPMSYEQLKSKITTLFAKSEAAAQKSGINREDYDLAKFALCAWIDEAILNSNWENRGEWQKEQLQRQFFSTTDAGIEFYNRLNALGLHQGEVREVYYFCLAMGFKGRYCREGEEILLQQLKASNLKLLTGSSVGLPSLARTEFFPEAYPKSTATHLSQPAKGLSSFSVIAILVGPVVFLGLLFVVYRFILGNVAENFPHP